MSIKSRVAALAAEKNISISELERHLNFANGSIGKWDKQIPSADRLQKAAEYFEVSTDYLLGRTEKKHFYDLDENDKVDIGHEVTRLMEGLDSKSEANFYGEPMTDDDKQKLRIAMQAALQAAQIESRKKFTPKKYRK